MSIVILLLFIAIIGGGIYWWIGWQRKRAIVKHEKLVRDAGLLDQTGSLSTSGLDKLANSPKQAPNAVGEEIDNTLSNGEALALPASATANTGGSPAPQKTRFSALEKRIEKDKVNIARLADDLLKAWNEASHYVRAWENSGRRLTTLKYEVERAGELHQLDDPAALPKFCKTLYESLVVKSTQRRINVESASKAPPSTIALRNAWQALVVALADYPEEDVQALFAQGRLSKQTAALVLSAHHARSTSKSSVESLRNDVKELESSGVPTAPPPIKVEKPEGDVLAALNQAQTMIEAALTNCLRQFLLTRASQGNLTSKIYQLEGLETTSFRKPQKPTPEEVMRYLMEVENHAAETLTIEREAYQAYKQTQIGLTELKHVLERLQRDIASHQTVLMDTGNPLYVCVHEAASILHSNMEQWLKEKESGLEAVQKRNLRRSEAVTSASPEEAEQIKLLRQLERTVGFAVAQSEVASHKLNTLRQDQPSEPRKPRVDREEDFTKLLSRFDGYLDTVTKTQADTTRWQAESQVVGMALAARNEKLAQSVSALMLKASPLAQSIKGKAGVSDELQIVIEAAALLARDNKH